MKLSIGVGLMACVIVFCPALGAGAALDRSGFRFVDGDGYRELFFDDKPIYRYVTKYDSADHHNTFKPFHHLYGFHNEGFITKGPGGLFSHHRGLFFGYKTQHGDFWHCKDVSQRHQRYLSEREFVDATSARAASVVEWLNSQGKAVVRETREVRALRPSQDRLVLDFDITVESLDGQDLKLGGDPQHAGFQFRAANEVVGADQKSGKTGTATYLRPEGAKFTRNDEWLNANWVACSFEIKDNPYTVVHMDHPGNPRPITYSTRPYARFGSYGPTTVPASKPLHLRYRIVVLDGTIHASPKVDEMDKSYEDYTSAANTTSPVR